MENIDLTYKLTKKLLHLREELLKWARLSRDGAIKESHQKKMMKEAFEIDEILRDIGIEWIEDYESNREVRAKIQ